MRPLLRLFPRSWRERYQTEMEAVLDDVPFSPRTALDLVLSAADAHLHPQGGMRPSPLPVILQLALAAAAAAVLLPDVAVVWLSVSPSPMIWLNVWIPVLVPGLATLVALGARWRAVAWFCGLLALQVFVYGNFLLILMLDAIPALEPLRRLAAGWHPASFRMEWVAAAGLALAAGAVVAVAVRRLGGTWLAGFAIGALLFAGADLEGVIVPAWAFSVLRILALGGLIAVLLRRPGVSWRTGLMLGCLLTLLLGAPFAAVLVRVHDVLVSAQVELPGITSRALVNVVSPIVIWPAVVALLFGGRRSEPAEAPVPVA
jgi:hypothetical protein